MKRKILIVDDDPKLRKTLFDILRDENYAPITASTGKEALSKIKEETPAVALIDLRLEDISGLEVMKGIKKYCSDIQCIVLTGYASQSSAIKAVNLGAYSYLQKPYDMEQLLVTIRRAIEKQEADVALRKSEERYRGLHESSLDGIASSDMDGNFLECNQAFADMLGYTKEEVLSLTFQEITPNKWHDIDAKLYSYKEWW